MEGGIENVFLELRLIVREGKEGMDDEGNESELLMALLSDDRVALYVFFMAKSVSLIIMILL